MLRTLWTCSTNIRPPETVQIDLCSFGKLHMVSNLSHNYFFLRNVLLFFLRWAQTDSYALTLAGRPERAKLKREVWSLPLSPKISNLIFYTSNDKMHLENRLNFHFMYLKSTWKCQKREGNWWWRWHHVCLLKLTTNIIIMPGWKDLKWRWSRCMNYSHNGLI